MDSDAINTFLAILDEADLDIEDVGVNYDDLEYMDEDDANEIISNIDWDALEDDDDDDDEEED